VFGKNTSREIKFGLVFSGPNMKKKMRYFYSIQGSGLNLKKSHFQVMPGYLHNKNQLAAQYI
jgi:hypothetical protein